MESKLHNYTFIKILHIFFRIISFCTKIYRCAMYVISPQGATEFRGSAQMFPKSSAESVSSSISPVTTTLSALDGHFLLNLLGVLWLYLSF